MRRLAACAVGAIAMLTVGCQAGGGNNPQYRDCEQGSVAEAVFVKGGSGGGARGDGSCRLKLDVPASDLAEVMKLAGFGIGKHLKVSVEADEEA